MDPMSDDSDQENNNNSMSKKTAEQRKLSYRNLLTRVEDIQESGEVGLDTASKIGDILRETNSLQKEFTIEKRVEHCEETLLDSMVLCSTSNLLVKCIEAIDVFTCTYEPSEFSQKVLRYINSEENDINILGLLNDARKIIPEVPRYNYVYGTYDLDHIPQPKPKKEKQLQKKEKLQKKEPAKVTELDETEASIDAIVKDLHNVLLEEYTKNNDSPIKYYDYVIDTDSFSNTVENIFYCSFLIRDGKAHLDLDKKGIPFIKPMKKRDLKAYRDQQGVNAQIITSISFDDWKNFNKAGLLQRHKAVLKR